MAIQGRYELDLDKPLIGVGAMGAVYRAVDLNLDHRVVALKTVKDISNPTILELFDREWRSIAKIRHDNIVSG
jgi:serine/threonine protein kinase